MWLDRTLEFWRGGMGLTMFFDRKLAERPPLGRLGEADDVAQLPLGVLEPPWVTGQIVHADGGPAVHSPIDFYGAVLPADD